MNPHSTDLDREFKEYNDNREFAKEVLISMAVSFTVGAIFATAMIFFCLSLID